MDGAKDVLLKIFIFIDKDDHKLKGEKCLLALG